MTGEPCGYTEGQILAYVAGDLVENEAVQVAEHLGACVECREQAVEFTTLEAALPGCCADGVVRWHGFETPFGTMYVATTADGLVELTWKARSAEAFVRQMEARFPDKPVVHDHAGLADSERQLREYFAGERSAFELSVDLSTLSPFERRVLEAARRIPFGEVVAYSELARRIGRPRASRAVGNALGHNPVAIIVPCHRVVRSDGRLGGYGGGIEYKKRLLKIEGHGDLARAS